MIHLQVVSGKALGTEIVASRFPFRVGRALSDQFQLVEPGVWEHHIELSILADYSVGVSCNPSALTCLNAVRIESGRLRSGDLLDLGGCKLRVSLSTPRQFSIRFTEFAVWTAVAALFFAQLIWMFRLG